MTTFRRIDLCDLFDLFDLLDLFDLSAAKKPADKARLVVLWGG